MPAWLLHPCQASMDKFPRWRNLKHISAPTNIDYSEGQTFVDICPLGTARCALPCPVRLVSPDSGLKITEKHGKSFNYLKHHFLSHAKQNFEGKGTSRNQNTRVGEGFQQEASGVYKITNGKNAEHQVYSAKSLDR
ncbi:hypothetical protein R3P38DRAFT_2582243 [Favolaschia claudopus]|uniref:Uncharacterized protein n=1 Tax=Favolaschia claudopus TaxID=2862362 RepID=A0AAV9ZAN8_9AGAR